MIRTLDIPSQYLERVQALVAASAKPVVVVDAERRVIASNTGAEPGRRVGDVDDALVHFVGAIPELSAYVELRAGFTAAVSHELRTPLARLLVLLESATLPDADVEALVERARDEVEQATSLIDDVLFLGELETGREVVALGTARVLPVVQDVVAELAERAANAEVALVVRVAADLELPMRPRMLRVVVENLVSNAVRYAGAGATCRIESSDRSLVVADNGAGVSEADLARLFERFYRADRARSTRGTGLGLAIVKHVVTAAGGTVEATGGRGRGLTIACRF
jgi:two-component system phosphate regulon sensor histidine kinase PhoR